jgi:hypothetical protein
VAVNYYWLFTITRHRGSVLCKPSLAGMGS